MLTMSFRNPMVAQSLGVSIPTPYRWLPGSEQS
jgi:hypothetical protein